MLATTPCHLGQSIMPMSQLEERNEPGLKASRHTHKGGACSATLDSLLADFCLEVTHVDCVISSPRTSFISSRHALRMDCEWRAQKSMVQEPEGCLRHTHQLRYFDATALHVAQGPEMRVVDPMMQCLVRIRYTALGGLQRLWAQEWTDPSEIIFRCFNAVWAVCVAT